MTWAPNAKPAFDALPQLDGYLDIRHVASGGFGEVFEAIDPAGRLSAVKVARTRFSERRLWYEAIALRCVGAPTVPALYDDGVDAAGTQYIAMEWIAAPTLDDRMQELWGPMSLPEFAIVTPRMLRAVEQLHNSGFVHRDLKPEHVVLHRRAQGLRVRLLDLGLVVPIHTEEPLQVRRRNIILGTSAYMAPEQVDLEPITPQTDIYALGVIMYEMLSGDVPFAGTSTEMQHAHVNARPPPMVGCARIPKPIAKVIERCLHKRPEKRYASVTSMRIALARALQRSGLFAETRAQTSPPSTL